MIIHGGIHTRETMSDFLAYNVNMDKWHIVPCLNSPTLSCHKITSIENSSNGKKRNKSYYMFGGKNQHGKAKNTLYKIVMVSEK